jgi:sigma-B regulation protein RsbU (phosphoserine phosphatase)
MAILLTLQGPEVGQKFTLDNACTILGRQFDCQISLQGRAVSRQHAQILLRDNQFFVEDLGSSNGTFLNNQRLPPRVATPFNEGDSLAVGPYTFSLRQTPQATSVTEPNLVIREKINALNLNQSVYGQDPATKLQLVLEIAQHVARTLDLEPLLDKLMEQLMRLLPQADRGMVILNEGNKLVVRAQRGRGTQDATTMPFSRTIVHRALEEGVGILSDDVQSDTRFNSSATLTSLNLHSVLCVPLINKEKERLGVIQMDRFKKGSSFKLDDLHLLTTVGMQMAVALENAAFHAERMREQRLMQELAMARDIQEGFLPTELEGFPHPDFEIYGKVCPARQVAGDLYDFFPVSDGRVAFSIGDVSGKGMPAALFMVAVRTLFRHLAKEAASPSQTLEKLNKELAADNNSSMFVTFLHGYYQPQTGEVVLASGGHPPPLWRHASGQTEELALPPGRLIGLEIEHSLWHDVHLQLTPGDTLVAVTDGILEARAPEGREMFGTERLQKMVERFNRDLSLPQCMDLAKSEVERFTNSKELQDDATLLMLRRC